jgi:xanthine dehydrogenase accessory factor
MDEKILRRIYESLDRGESAAMAVLTEDSGSTPRKSGSIMAVWQDGRIFGSVGGGKVEYAVITKAIECIEKKEDSSFEYKLNEQDLGMKCGGEVKGFIKVFYPRTKLIIAGAGHIGEKLYHLARILDFYTVILDDREEFANRERFKDVDEIIVGDIGESLAKYEIGDKDFIVIVTRGHMQDKAALKAAVGRGAAYVGVIGSTRKLKLMMKELMEEGVSRQELQKAYAPIGLDLGSNLPEEIALGILSQIVLVKNKGTLSHMKDIKKVWD